MFDAFRIEILGEQTVGIVPSNSAQLERFVQQLTTSKIPFEPGPVPYRIKGENGWLEGVSPGLTATGYWLDVLNVLRPVS